MAGPRSSALFIFMLAAGMSGSALAERNYAQVSVEKPASQLSGVHYAWVTNPGNSLAEQDQRVSTPEFRERMQAALDKELESKGYQRVGPNAAELLMAYRAGVRDVEQPVIHEYGSEDTRQATLECTGDGCSQLVTRNGAGEPVLKVKSSDEVQAGLMVEVIERHSLKVLWRATDEGTAKSAQVNRVSLEQVAHNILAQLPQAPRSE